MGSASLLCFRRGMTGFHAFYMHYISTPAALEPLTAAKGATAAVLGNI